MGAIALRVQAPGVQADLAARVANALDVLRGLCGQLPATVPEAPIAAAPAAASSSTSSTSPIPQAGGAAAAAADAATGDGTATMPPVPAPPTATTDGATTTGAGAADAEEHSAHDASDIDVDAEGCDEESVLEGLSPAQRERIRQLMGTRSRRKGAPKTLAKPAERDGRTKKPAKGGD